MKDKIRNFKTAREGKTALRNYCRRILGKYKKAWAASRPWTDGNGVFHDESILINRIGVSIVKWDSRYRAAIVCVYDKTKPITMSPFDGQEYHIFHTWSEIEFWHVWEMINRLSNRILGLLH